MEKELNEKILESNKTMDLMKLFPKILNVEKKNFQITPSEYIREMSLTMEERHKKLVHIANTMKTVNTDYPPQFKVIPNILIFQRFEPRSTNRLILAIRNVGKCILAIKMFCPSSVYFSANFAGTPTTKLAPGLSIEYEVTFTAEETKDYFHFLTFTSKDHTFQVPIIAIGLRPMLDIPDQIILNPAPVKISTSKFIMVRNIGNAPAVFNFITQSYYFRVAPAKGILLAHDSMLLNISFESPEVKEVSESLLLMLETGEKLSITLHGSAENISVRLDKNSIVHEDTFLGLKRCKTVRLINNSSSVIKFSWKKNKTKEEDLSIIESTKDKYKEITEMEMLKDAKVIYYGLSNARKHKNSCERILKDELRLLEREEFNFNHESFSIMPLSGEVWPKGSVELLIAFEPKTCGPACAEAYLEASGRDSRLPLKIKANGIGPDIILNMKMLDISFIYLCSLHRYEFTAENKGDIPGTIQYLEEALVFGGKVELTPKSKHLKPGELASFILSFNSNRPGDFTEKLFFLIKESKEKICLVLKGKVVSPTLHFDIKLINFGIVPLGFPKKHEVTLSNLSVVPVTFSLRVLLDGEQPSISYSEFARCIVKPALPLCPKEFKVEPEESVVEPFSSKKVTLILTANRIGNFNKKLVVDMWDSETGSVSCPITYRAFVPTILAQPESLTFPFCFLNFPYSRPITLRNLSKVAGFFYIVPTDSNEITAMTCSPSIPQGVIQPHSSVDIDLTLMTSALGRHVLNISILTFGFDHPREICTISFVGQGPVVTIKPNTLNWGDLPLLETVDKVLEIANESPIPAALSLSMTKANSPWSANPSNIIVGPERSVKVIVTLVLNERGKFKDVLKVNVFNGKDMQVPLTATGSGSCLIFSPDITPEYYLGTLFSFKKYEFSVSIDNKGMKPYSLIWSPFPDYKLFANLKFVSPADSVFKFEPTKIDIAPREITTAKLKVYCNGTGTFTETFYCFASFGNPTKELHLTTEVKADFVAPKVNFDKTEINFWYNIGCDENDNKLIDTISVSNMAVLPISVEASTSQPFCLAKHDDFTHTVPLFLEGLETTQLRLKFVGHPNPNKNSRIFKGKLLLKYKDYNITSSINLTGEVNYPNVYIQPMTVDFGHVLVGMTSCKDINLTNISPLTVYYNINWNVKTSELAPFDNNRFIKSPISNLDGSALETEPGVGEALSEVSEVMEPSLSTENNLAEVSETSVSHPPVMPVPRMPEVEISNSEIKTALFPLIRNYYTCNNELIDAYKMARSSDTELLDISLSDLFDITPFYGKLEPYSSQVLTITFSSTAAVKARVEALLSIKSGPVETIKIDAVSTEIEYELSATELDFGKQLFCETKSQILTVKNHAVMPFSFEAISDVEGVCDMSQSFPLGKGVLTVSPASGIVKSFEQAELIIRYHPGVPGQFEDTFFLQIAHFELITVTVKGIGVFPQVHVRLPRPDILDVAPEVGYLAVASITPDWMLAGSDVPDMCSLKPYRSRDSNWDSLLKADSKDDEWDFVDSLGFVPSEIDMSLAVERILAYSLISQDTTKNATFAVYARTIPRFNVPAYLLDFGICVIGQTTEQHISVTNFGPLPVILYGIFESKMKEEGIYVRLKNRNELKIGASLLFTVVFHPKKSKFRKKYEKLETEFYFEIYHGPKIPIRILAQVTYPHVIASMNILNFSSVVCGCCKVISLRLKNPGLVPAQWSVNKKKASETSSIQNVSSDVRDGESMFYFSCTSGELNPGQYCTLQVTFKPELGGAFSAVLHIDVVKSLSNVKILLMATAVEPKLNISPKILNFKATTPFAQKKEKIFSVENPCVFPIEYYFPDFDEQLFEEDKIIRALSVYYGEDSLLLPVRQLGEGLPPEITDFYHMLLEGLNAKFLEDERIKMQGERESLEENVSSVFSVEEDLTQASVHKKKKFRKMSRSRTSMDTSREFVSTGRESNALNIFERFQPQEIESMLEDYIKTLKQTNPVYDPVQAALKSNVLPVKEEYREGTLIVFHGAPLTHSVQLANRAAVFLEMFALNIDRIILEEAALGRCEAGILARDLIEQAYSEHAGAKGKKRDSRIFDWNEFEDEEFQQLDYDTKFDEIQRKFDALVDFRENVMPTKKTSTSARSDTPRKVEKSGTPGKPQINAKAPIANISEDIVEDILRYRISMEASEGVIIEGLQSAFVTSPTKTLLLLLKAAGNIKDIIVIFFLKNYVQFTEYQQNFQKEQELAELYLREEMLRILEEEPEEVFQNLNLLPEVAKTLREVFLSKRHEFHEGFDKKKERFYETQRRLREVLRRKPPGSLLPIKLDLEPEPVGDKKEKESGKKKEGGKNPKTPGASNRISESALKSTRFKRDSLEGEFLSFEMDFAEMKRIIENWDQRLGALVVDPVVEAKNKKGQTPRKPDSVASSKLNTGRGVFLWIVDVSNPISSAFPACCSYLKTSLLDKPIPQESDDWPLNTNESMTFSVVTSPPRRTRSFVQSVFFVSAAENFVVVPEDGCEDMGEYTAVIPTVNSKINRSASSISFQTKKRETTTSKRRKTDSRMSTDKNIKSKRPLSTALTEEDHLKPRWILQPGETHYYRVRFFPVEPGQYKKHYPLTIVTWHNDDSVCCKGICDIPRLDMRPEVLFPVVEQCRPLNKLLSEAYYISESTYDFGSVITVATSEGRKCIEKLVHFTTTNISSLPIDLAVILSDNGTGEDSNALLPIRVQPNKVWLKPGESKRLAVMAKAYESGFFEQTLHLVIKDNPKVEGIRVAFEGVRANITVHPTTVDFERVLLHRKENRLVVFTNNNTVPLYIVLKGHENFPDQFSFTETSGWISPLKTFLLEIEFRATEVLLIKEKPIQVLVYKCPESSELIQEFMFDVNAEAYDVALDVIFFKPEDDHIDFGDIRIENPYSIEFNMKNIGKYQIGYRIEIDWKLLNDSGNDQFYLQPSEGTLFPGKLFPVVVSFQAHNEVTWKRINLFKIMLVEPFCADELIATIPIAVSARSHFSRYELSPSELFKFGHIRVGSLVTRSLVITNTGHFSFSYFIELQTPTRALETGNETTKKSSKHSLSSKEKPDKGKKTSILSLKAGIFEIYPSSGSIETGQKAVVNVTCCPDKVQTFEEKVVVFVNESVSTMKKGVQLTISVEGCLPVIQFNDPKTMFREHLLCWEESEIHSRIQLGSHTLYVEKENLFLFKNICVNKAAEARIHLRNNGLVEGQVIASVEPRVEEGSRMALPAESHFSVSPQKLIIEPYGTGCLVLTFLPDALEVYSGRLMLSLEMPETFSDEEKMLDLWGNGILPHIEITEPNTKLPEGQTLVTFPAVSPGLRSTSSIAFANVGLLHCKVVIELYKATNSAFTLTPKPSTEKMLKIWELTKPIDHTAIVSLAPGEVAEFEVAFNPIEVQTYSSQIKLFVVDNPFENWCYRLVGEVFFEEVIIEKIRTALPFLAEDDGDKRTLAPIIPGQYFVNLGECQVKKKSKVLLKLANKTEKGFYRFEWDKLQLISVFPAIGHLYPKCYKEVLIVFDPEEPMELENVTLLCMINKILFRNPPEISWDSRLVYNENRANVSSPALTSSPHSNSALAQAANEEPEYELIPDSKKMLYVNISGIVDYARLTCDITKIVFKNTFMFQTRMYPLVLENSGNVSLEYKLTLKSVTVCPLKASKMSQPLDSSLMNVYPANSRPRSSAHLESARRQRPLTCGKRPRPLTSVPLLDLKNSCSNSVTNYQPSYVIYQDGASFAYNPLTIENASGQIQPKEKKSCNIIFSPMDINEYRAIVKIQVANIHPECNLPDIEVTASSIMPYCHFDVPESDYLESGRRDYSRPGPVGYAPGVPLHPDTKTIETKVLGVGVTTPIKFHVINPTEEEYAFSWSNTTQSQPGVVPSFHCSTIDGRIRPGRQQLMTFSFVSQTLGITESFWKFSIPKFGVETPFLFVGDVRDPAVYFLSRHVNLMPTLIGSSSSDVVVLANYEDIPFDFYFIPESLYSEGRLNFLKVEPPSGKILPHSELSLRLTFTGKTAGKTLFNVKCKIKSIKEPFIITVEATTYGVQPIVVFEDLNKVKHHSEVNKENVIDFGSELSPNRPETVTITLTSFSKTSFYYEWEFNQRLLDLQHCKLKFSVKNGHVASFSTGKCDITVIFSKKSSLVNFQLKLKIRRGPTFVFLINASASTPLYKFSFHCYDFGFCSLQQKDICYYETTLVIKNKEAGNLLLECSLSKLSAFSYLLSKSIIPPEKELTIPIFFHPKDCIPYEDQLKFTINGLHEKIVVLKGHGTEFKVTLANAEDTTIALGAVKAGKTSCRKIWLVNKGLGTAVLVAGFSDQLPVSGSHLAKPKEHPLDLSKDHRLTGVITIFPSTVFRIKPQEKFPLTFTYTPHHKSSPFSETVYLQHQETAEPLCLLTGCCLGPEISLDRDIINFGAVVETCTTTLKLKLINSGSYGARFEWSTESLTDFLISPAWGYCSPESDVTIAATFCPTSVQNCIRKSVECKLYLSENETYPSLMLELIGDCIPCPEPIDVVTFECFVRETDTKVLEIENPSGQEWQLLPAVSGEYFNGLDALIIPSLSSANYQVNYSPLTMTEEDSHHEGSVFFRLPNGQILLYRLLGISAPPKPEDVIEREVPCKTKYVELLKVKNWLHYPQRFKITITGVECQDEAVYTCTGLENLEVPALSQKEYSLNFFTYNVGFFKFHVIFKNEETQEYIWYDVGFNVSMCGPLEVITLKTGVRQTSHHELKLENPLKETVLYELETTSPEVSFENSVWEVPPEQTIYVNVYFTPIHPGEKTEKLTATCHQLGVFPRELRLIGVELQLDPPRRFETLLGASQTQEVFIKNFSHLNAILVCKVDSDQFIVVEQSRVEAGQSTQIKVTYEPSETGSTSATLFVQSEQAGNFIFPLVGICDKPLPKGPFVLRSGSGVHIPFKNVLKTAKEFHMYVDNPAFVLKTAQETLLPKEETKIFVGMQKTKHLEKLPEYRETELKPKFPLMGQLIVECFSPYVKWQFYLKGLLDN